MTTRPRTPDRRQHRLERRDLFRLGLAGTGPTATGTRQRGLPTSTQPSARATTQPNGAAPRVLVAYSSRAGEDNYYGDRTWLEVGNTDVVARMIAQLVDCDLHKIEAADPYPTTTTPPSPGPSAPR